MIQQPSGKRFILPAIKSFPNQAVDGESFFIGAKPTGDIKKFVSILIFMDTEVF